LSVSVAVYSSSCLFSTYRIATVVYTLSLHDALPICSGVINSSLNVFNAAPARNTTLLASRLICWAASPDVVGRRLINSSSFVSRSEEHTSELQSRENLVCRLLLEKKKINS